jgi:transcriptional regulator with XRE-family HTH domain
MRQVTKIYNMNKNRLKKLGFNIKVERIRKELNQEQLAEKVNTSRNSISSIENGKQSLSALKLIDISNALGIEINELVKDV